MLFLPLPPRRFVQETSTSAVETVSHTTDRVPVESGVLESDGSSRLRLPIFASVSISSPSMKMGSSSASPSDPTPKDEDDWLRRASFNAVRNQRMCSSLSADTTVRHSAIDNSDKDDGDGFSRSVSFENEKDISFYHLSSPVGEVLKTKILTKTFDGCSDLDSTRFGSVREFESIEELLIFAQRMSHPPARTPGNRKRVGAVDSVASGSVGSFETSPSTHEPCRPAVKLRPARFGFEEAVDMEDY